MVYKKVTLTALAFALISAIISNVVFAATDITSNDQIIDSTMQVLIFLQKYSWPIITLVFIYALYQFYVAGSELLEQKISGQKLIVGLAIFMAIIQTMPLIYAFIIVR
ncbi:MAG: hypothetical protein N2749_02710 [Clostridia bacterium]|nr:hypothetical protein [Clostridia bacterium]